MAHLQVICTNNNTDFLPLTFASHASVNIQSGFQHRSEVLSWETIQSTMSDHVWYIDSSYEPHHDKTNKITVRPAKTRISLGIHPVWSESSLCAQWVAKDRSFLHADSEESDQTGRMPRLIWVFAGCTVILLRLVLRHNYDITCTKS